MRAAQSDQVVSALRTSWIDIATKTTTRIRFHQFLAARSVSEFVQLLELPEIVLRAVI